MGRAAAILLGVCVAAAAGAASARPAAGPPTKAAALALVRGEVRQQAAPCGHRLVRLGARRNAGGGWRVTAVVRGRRSGASVWLVRSRRPVPVNALARQIRAGCPTPPVTPEPPPAPPAVTAPATYVFGAEVTAAEQASLRAALDAGARFVKTRLGRDVPPFTVWAHTDLEALIGVYVATNGGSVEAARATWSTTWAAAGNGGRSWWGPRWFAADATSRFKVAVHELVHVVQGQLLGDVRLGGSADEVPPAGPRWLTEGMAEYLGYMGADAEGLAPFGRTRATWVGQLAGTATPLRAFENLRGFQETQQAWAVVSLAVELLARGRGEPALLTYYESVGLGVPWRDAFARAFGRTIEVFYDEFEAFRRAP